MGKSSKHESIANLFSTFTYGQVQSTWFKSSQHESIVNLFSTLGSYKQVQKT